MVSARSFFSRMNQSRNENWLTDAQLLKGSEEFFRSTTIIILNIIESLNKEDRYFLHQ